MSSQTEWPPNGHTPDLTITPLFFTKREMMPENFQHIPKKILFGFNSASNWQYPRMHQNKTYDLEINSSKLSALDCAQN